MLNDKLFSLERIQGYIDIEQEPKPSADGIPPAHWPSSGEILAENLCARYSAVGICEILLVTHHSLFHCIQNGPEVLHGISFHIRSGERIGVGECSSLNFVPHIENHK